MNILRKPAEPKPTKFWTFYQNNSGGTFDYSENDGIGQYVIVEATDIADAIYRAKRIGLYFDGDGDCPCCGDRWTEPWQDGTDRPEMYGQFPSDYMADPKRVKFERKGQKTVFVHMIDGTIYWY